MNGSEEVRMSVWMGEGEVRVGVSQTKRKTGREEREREGDRRVSHDVRERRTPIEMVA